MQDATARVYERGGNEPFLSVATGTDVNVDFADTFINIVAFIESNSISFGEGEVYFSDACADPSPVNCNTASELSNGLPVINGSEVAIGDVIRIADPNKNPNPFDMTVRIYERSSDNALAVAFGEDSITLKAAVSLSANEFFLDGNSVETNNITAAMEFMPVICADRFTSDDMTTCRAIDATDCTGATPAFANGVCVDVCPNNIPDFDTDGKTCIAATTPTLTCDAASTTGQNGDECTCRTGYTQRISPEMCAMPQNPQTGNNTQPQKSGGKNHTGALIFGGLMIMGAIGYAIDGDVSPFNFSPDFGYDITESGYAANAGGRIDFRKDNWHLYQSADSDFHRNGSSEFRYTSGGKYKGDLFSATFSESVQGETADYDFSLSAKWAKYRLHSRFDKGETETRNELFMQKQFRYNGWTINPSAGFQWRNFGNFAENARFRIDAVHRF